MPHRVLTIITNTLNWSQKQTLIHVICAIFWVPRIAWLHIFYTSWSFWILFKNSEMAQMSWLQGLRRGAWSSSKKFLGVELQEWRGQDRWRGHQKGDRVNSRLTRGKGEAQLQMERAGVPQEEQRGGGAQLQLASRNEEELPPLPDPQMHRDERRQAQWKSARLLATRQPHPSWRPAPVICNSVQNVEQSINGNNLSIPCHVILWLCYWIWTFF